MKWLKEFDEALKHTEVSEEEMKTGYWIGNKPPYTAYQENAAWQQFLNEMKTQYPDAYRAYSEGDGKELEEKRGMPPKMASFASSSRMIYHSAREHRGFIFERKLPTTVGGTANLDGYMEAESGYVFVEAKCREPYSHKGTVTVGRKYEELYECLIQNHTKLAHEKPIDSAFVKQRFAFELCNQHRFAQLLEASKT